MSGLVDRYDLVVLDLDGVVILSDRPVEGAPEALARLRSEGRRLMFATNNASRSAAEVAALLTRIGVQASADEVLTSASAAAEMLGQRLEPGANVLVVGSDALRDEVRGAGLTPVASADELPVAVVQGYHENVGWKALAEACLAIRAGAWWVATNADKTLPSPRGPLPGNGSLVAALATALGRRPDVVVGKPEPGLFTSAARVCDSRDTLVVGDRLDTDIAGARRAGMDSLLVLTGVSTADDAAAAVPGEKPTYVATNLLGLFAVA